MIHQLPAKIHPLEGGGVMFWCAACDGAHGGPGWNEITPGTVFPSVVLASRGCHVEVRDYTLHYLPDCTNGWGLVIAATVRPV